jgi:NACHT domain
MRRLPRAIWISIVIIGILTMLATVMGNIGTAALTWLSPQVALVLFVLISLALIGVSLWRERQEATSELSPDDTRNYREIMLNLIQNTWITGFLENPLYYSYDEQLLSPPLRGRIGSRFDLVLSNPLEPTKAIPSDTAITQVFNQAGGELLILGEPGAGKTTLLLELARDLLKRANDNPAAPIPVMLILSSWATRKLPLEQWIAEELQAKYDIPSQIGITWVKANQLLLLLDGLDEVAPSALPACIEAINAYYHQAHRSLAMRATQVSERGARLRTSRRSLVVMWRLTVAGSVRARSKTITIAVMCDQAFRCSVEVTSIGIATRGGVRVISSISYACITT